MFRISVRDLLTALRFGYLPPNVLKEESSVEVLDIGEEEAAEGLLLRMEGIVAGLESPIMVPLSGGVDSAFVYQMVRDCFPASKIVTVNVGNWGVADYYVEPDFGWVTDTLDLVNENTYRDLFFSSSLIVTRGLYRAWAGEVGSIVTGDGGDELFCGYDRYLLPAWGGFKFSRRGAKFLNYLLHGYEGSLSVPMDACLATDFQYPGGKAERMVYDIQNELRYVEIPKVETAARMAGVEGRVHSPFLKPEVFDFCSRLPLRLKYRWGVRKVLLRRMLKDRCGIKVPHRKVGFAIPDGWVKNELDWSLQVVDRMVKNGMLELRND